MAEMANRTIAMKNTIFAASMAPPATMPKPSNAAITGAWSRKSATCRKRWNFRGLLSRQYCRPMEPVGC